MSVHKIKSIKETCYCADARNNKLITSDFISSYYEEYDEKGNSLVHITYNTPKRISEKIEHRYNEIGQLVEYIRTDFEYKTAEKVGYLYESNRIKEISVCDLDGNLIRKTIRQCNENGNEIEDKDYDKNGKLISTSKLLYDDKDNLLEFSSLSVGKENGHKMISTYDENGREIEKQQYRHYDSELKRKTTTKFDDKGNSVEVTTYDFEDEKIYQYTNEYLFDKYGNWIVQYTYESITDISTTRPFIEYQDKRIPAHITKREIEYF